MKRNNWIWLGLLGIVLVVSAGWYWFHNQSVNTSDQEQASIGKTATLYLHGYSGGAGSTNTLIRHAKQARATKVLTATVSKNGKVSWLGSPHHVRKPIVQVVFEDNRNPDAVKWADWLATVNRQLYQRYGVRNVIIGMGDQPHQIKLAANGYPSPLDENYAELARMRDRFPKGVKVLNIYGDLRDGSDSDGRVSNNSSRSLRYLVSPRAAGYREREYFGRDAQHSALHENPKVAQAVDAFLW